MGAVRLQAAGVTSPEYPLGVHAWHTSIEASARGCIHAAAGCKDCTQDLGGPCRGVWWKGGWESVHGFCACSGRPRFIGSGCRDGHAGLHEGDCQPWVKRVSMRPCRLQASCDGPALMWRPCWSCRQQALACDLGYQVSTNGMSADSCGQFARRQDRGWASHAQNLMLTKLIPGLPAPTLQRSLAELLSCMLVLQAVAGSRAFA